MKKMKFTGILSALIIGAAAIGAASCQDMLNVESGSYVFAEDHRLDSANDSLYSAIGILSCMQSLGERYVLLGELRADLVSVPATAPVDMQNISAFRPMADPDALGLRRDYYTVINNCNVALARMDTAITERGTQIMMPEYAAIRTMRAWTMLQAALAYGSVNFITEPILDLESAEKTYPAIGVDELVGRLIADLEPYAVYNVPNYGSIDGLSSRQFFIRPALLLGDLYLYNGNYSQAAAMYYYVINEESYNIEYTRGNLWASSVRAEYTVNHINTYQTELVAGIPYASDAKKYHPNLVNLTYNTTPSILPASWFIDHMNTASHFHVDQLGSTNITGYFEGDLRGMLVDREAEFIYSSYGYVPVGMAGNEYLITKYFANGEEYSSVTNPSNAMYEKGDPVVITRTVATLRIPHIYLRYAEAVNRAGKPTLAFAVLKYGLRNEVLEDPEKVDPAELADNVEWTNFSDTRFANNYGTAMRGRGLGIAVEDTDFVIPDFEDKDQVIEWVEDAILDEMAAETCFEGNRFFDLLRISHHRSNHPAYMAEKISRRFDNPAEIESRLSDMNNFWIK